MWEAFGRNYDDVGPPPSYGYFEGERDDVIEWIELKHPGFKAEVSMKYGAELREIRPHVITRGRVIELRQALETKAVADAALKRAEAAVKKA